MREEIRLGNEALARNDMETAQRCFQQLLSKGGTSLQRRIAENRLREIQEKRDAADKLVSVKPRVRRKAKHVVEHEDTAKHTFVRLPDKPLVVIKKH